MAPTRRTVLQASALGLAGSVAGCAGASENRQETETTTEATGETTTTRRPDETVVLGGRVEYWYGVAPSSIQGSQNPTLTMQPGTVYEVVWMNLDGVEHELRIFDADDDEVASTDTASAVGETSSVVVEATESLARYDCEYHPESMQGQIGQDGATTTETTTEEDGGGGVGY